MKRHLIRMVTAAFLTAVLVPAAWAKSDESKMTSSSGTFAASGVPSAGARSDESKNASLEKRVEALEKILKERGASPFSADIGKHKFNLLLQIIGAHEQTPGTPDAFKGKRAELKLSGNLVPKRIDYALMIDPFLVGNITKDAYVSLTYIPFADIQFGQFKFPQGLEGRWKSSDLDFIERAVVSNTFGDKRDFALQLSDLSLHWGDMRGEYAVALVNGAGQNTSENNDHKDFAGRAGAEWKGLWLGTNGYLGQEPTGERTRIGGELRYVFGNAKLQAEYLWGKTENLLGGPSLHQQGYYVLANYVWKWLRPGLRWESFDPNLAIKGNRKDALTAGLDLLLTQDRKNKVSLNYTKRIEENAQTPNDTAAVQVQVSF